jgi:multiple sugar transport system ATP-binding protein
MATVTFEGVTRVYPGNPKPSVDSLDLEIADGEFLVLVGPSGCGKSTLLRMIAGLESITDGEIDIGGRVVNELEPKERDIAMVFQSYALYPHMTVRDNMAFSLKLSRKSKQEIESEVRRAAEILALEPLLDRYPRQLSGGQRQRVAMGRAIVRHPAVFLFDEPLSNLDAKLRVQMRGEIKALHSRLKATMIYVTHDQMEAMTMADRIVVMRAGKIEQIGSPLEIYDNPANAFVGGFIGSPSMNFVDGTVAEENGQIVLRDVGGIAWPLGERGRAYIGRTVQVGIRPEHIRVGDEGVAATVLNIEPTGSETHLQVEVGGQPMIVVVHDRLAVEAGASVRIAADPNRVTLFDQQSGVRLA